MITMLRRLFWLGLLGGAGYAGWTLWQRQTSAPPAAAPEWPPMPAPAASEAGTAQGSTSVSGATGDLPDVATPDDTAEIVDAVPSAPEPATADGRRWVDPLPDGGCPDGHPIKAKDNSGIYHVPGGRFYDRTAPERCYADAADAEADGYRAAKA